MTKKEKGAEVVRILKEHYPDTCSLVAQKDYELLFATRLSAQCTDARVNLVTAVLYERYPTLESLAEADLEDLCTIVKPCGLFRTKANDIKNASIMLLERPSLNEGITKISASLILTRTSSFGQEPQ